MLVLFEFEQTRLMKVLNLSNQPDTHLVEAKGPDELLVHLILARLGERVL